MDNNQKAALVKYFFCLVICVFLFHFQATNNRILQYHINLNVISDPFYSLVTSPIRFGEKISDWFKSKQDALISNERLLLENELLKAKLLKLESIELENDRLIALMSSSARLKHEFLLAEVMDISLKAYQEEILINKGAVDDVYVGQPVIDQHGVVGQVTKVNLKNSVITLITNVNHSTPVQVRRNGLRVIVSGNGSRSSLDLNYLSPDSDIRQGDLLVTSGLGGVFPSGYPVATVSGKKEFDNISFLFTVARPEAKLNHGNNVILLWPKDTDFQNDELEIDSSDEQSMNDDKNRFYHQVNYSEVISFSTPIFERNH